MKRYIVLLYVSFAYVILSYSQCLLFENIVPKRGDSIIVFQQPYFERLDSGTNCIWDFSNLNEYNEINLRVHSKRINNYDVLDKHQAFEHIYYQQKHDSLFIIGRESSLYKIDYYLPEPIMKDSFGFGDTIHSAFAFREIWGNGNTHIVEGTVSVFADAMGQLIIPTDTLDSIVRLQTIEDYIYVNSQISSLRYHSSKWYSKNSHYPIVEVIQISYLDSVSIAYTLYNPQNSERAQQRKVAANKSNTNNEIVIPAFNVICYPNPVFTNLEVQYTIEQVTPNLSFSLYTISGICVYSNILQQREVGDYVVQIPMNHLPRGVYTLCVRMGDQKVDKEIIKL